MSLVGETPEPRSMQSAPGYTKQSVTATVVRRVVDGEPQIVVVCEGCESIRTIKVADAMQTALDSFLKRHDQTRHVDRDEAKR